MIESILCPLLLAAASTVARESGEDITGTWQVTEFVYEGKALPRDKLDRAEATITKGRITLQLPGAPGLVDFTYRLVPDGIDLLDAGDKPHFDPLLGVFDLKGDVLRIAFHNVPQDGTRPKAPRADKELTYFVLKRAPKPRTFERGGAIIDLTEPGPRTRERFTLETRVLDVFDGTQVLLSFGTDQGAEKGQKGFLHTGYPRNSRIPYVELVELTDVGTNYSIGRFQLNGGALSMMLQNKDNPVRNQPLVWYLLPDQSYVPRIPVLPARFQRGGAIIDLSDPK
jgi:uncharacterized protein (TIGR03067 family)